MWSETNIWAKIKLGLIVVLAVLAIILFINNTDTVPVNLIFGDPVHLPLILLLLAVMLVGVLLGVLLSMVLRRRKERKKRDAE